MKLRRSPFKVNVVENDPNAFGLRAKEVISCVEALYNGRSVLLSGPRGIGKSSMGYQLQKVMEGDSTLLRRCGIETRFPKTLCVFYACDSTHTLEQLTLDILYRLEDEARRLLSGKIADVKSSFEVNLGVVKASLEAAVKAGNRSPATIATQLVAGLEEVSKGISRFTPSHGINIMLDELDQLSQEINFGHFIKVLHETLIQRGLNKITFIFAGQKGIYTRFLQDNPSFERIVRHVPLSILDEEASMYVLDYASHQASPTFTMDKPAKDLIVAISSGYPYVLHLLGDAAFWEMKNERHMTLEDVALGIEAVLKSDKREKYFSSFRGLSQNERVVLIALSKYPSNSVPSEVPYNELFRRAANIIGDASADAAIESLVRNGFLMLRKDQTIVMFVEELYRIFISIMLEEQRMARIRRIQEERGARLSSKQEVEILRLIQYGDIDWDEIRLHLSDTDRAVVLQEVRKQLFGRTYTTAWEDDEEEADMFVDNVVLEDDEYDYLDDSDEDDDEWWLDEEEELDDDEW